MFTGVIQETGMIERIERGEKFIRLTICAPKTSRNLKIGDSVAVNGCCLTAVKMFARGKLKLIQFDLLHESWRLTNFQFLKTGSLVNLERPMRAGDEFGGHFVTGHVDGIGRIKRREKSGVDHIFEITAPPNVLRYVILKGSITVDGISLTVAGVGKKSFCVWIIPHTMSATALRERKVGDAVNLEADLLGKYAEKFLSKK